MTSKESKQLDDLLEWANNAGVYLEKDGYGAWTAYVPSHWDTRIILANGGSLFHVLSTAYENYV